MGAPWSHYYFHYLDTYIPPTPEPFTQTTAVKVFIDQFIQAPILLALMISLLSIMKGTGVDGVKTDMGDNYGASLIANCKYLALLSWSRRSS
jgi:peroxisomal membrane protein 2